MGVYINILSRVLCNWEWRPFFIRHLRHPFINASTTGRNRVPSGTYTATSYMFEPLVLPRAGSLSRRLVPMVLVPAYSFIVYPISGKTCVPANVFPSPCLSLNVVVVHWANYKKSSTLCVGFHVDLPMTFPSIDPDIPLITRQAVCIPVLAHLYTALATHLLLAAAVALASAYVACPFGAHLALQIVFQIRLAFWGAVANVAGAEVGFEYGGWGRGRCWVVKPGGIGVHEMGREFSEGCRCLVGGCAFGVLGRAAAGRVRGRWREGYECAVVVDVANAFG